MNFHKERDIYKDLPSAMIQSQEKHNADIIIKNIELKSETAPVFCILLIVLRLAICIHGVSGHPAQKYLRDHSI